MADYTVTAANVLASSGAIRFPPVPGSVLRLPPYAPATVAYANVNLAGESLTAGQPVYQDPTLLTFFRADADAASPNYKVVGIAENSAATGQPVSVLVSDPDFACGITTLLVGDIVIVSTNPGGLMEAAGKASGNKVAVVGVAKTTTTINLQIVRSDAAKA